MACPQVADGGKPPIWQVAMNILNKQSDSQQGWGPPAGGWAMS